jgi:signal transduction histidine kinase/CheY-like chemotaxis protein
MMKFLDRIRGKTGSTYSLATLLYRDTILVVSALVFFLVLIVFVGLYLNYQNNLDTYSKEYIQDVKNKLKLTVDKTIKQSKYLTDTLSRKAEQRIIDNVNFAYNVTSSIYKSRAGKASKHQIIKEISTALREVRLDSGAGYFFILDASNGVTYLHAADPRFEGQSQINFKNSNGRLIIKEMLEIANEYDNGFVTYKFRHPNRNVSDNTKVTYIRKFKDLNIIIGTGYYKEDVKLRVQEDIKEYILSLADISDGYVWVVDTEGTLVVHKYLKDLVGKSVLHIKDPNGIPIARGIIEASLKNGDGFLRYIWMKPSLGKEVPKISYGKRHEEWGWVFVTGNYIDDISRWEKRMRHEFTAAFIQEIVLALAIAIILIIVLSYIIKRNFSKLNKGFNQFNNFFANPSKSLSDGDLRGIPYEEFQILSRSTEVISEYHKMLRDEKNKAEAALVARNEFLNNMSHEIRTPMNVIIGMADILDESKMNVEQKKFLDSFQDACNNLLTILNDILDLSKLESQTFELDHSRFNLKEKLEKTVELFRLGAEKKELEVMLEFDESINPNIVSDQVRLGQVISNLIGNSIKFTQFGHVELRVKLLATKENSQKIRFSVYDTGIGIEKESVEKIFSKFMQADTSVTRRYGGTGLGLSISKRIVEAFGGELRVESEPAKYTEFIFELEFETSHEVEEKVSKEKFVDSEIKNSHVLVVDDTDDNLLLIKKFLKHPNITIMTAENGVEALKLFKREKFDLILMDIQMPVMDGYEATKRIRELETELGTHTPIYALTAYAMTENINKSLAAGCDGHISKPIRKKEIQSFVFSKLA